MEAHLPVGGNWVGLTVPPDILGVADEVIE
jgi:hypothetical protein